MLNPEADRGSGVIREPAVHRRVLRELLSWATDEAEHATVERHFTPCGLIASPITGRDGNHEYLLLLRTSETDGCRPLGEQDIEAAVQQAFAGSAPKD